MKSEQKGPGDENKGQEGVEEQFVESESGEGMPTLVPAKAILGPPKCAQWRLPGSPGGDPRPAKSHLS